MDDKSFPNYNDESVKVWADSIDLSRPLSTLFIPQEPGIFYLCHTMSYEYKDSDNSGHLGGANREFVVVEKFGKALNDEGFCNNLDLFRYQKSDHSGAVCVIHPIFLKLIQRVY